MRLQQIWSFGQWMWAAGDHLNSQDLLPLCSVRYLQLSEQQHNPASSNRTQHKQQYGAECSKNPGANPSE